MVTFKNVSKKELDVLLAYGFSYTGTKTEYEAARLQGPCTLILYKSGKLLLQGTENEVKRVKNVLVKMRVGEEILSGEFKEESGIVIGSDESLKGDTFGGLVVAAVKADDKIREKLWKLGVEESKQLTDKQVAKLAARIKDTAPYSVRNLYPEEYNSYELTPLLNRLHREVKEELGFGTHIVDKYPGCMVGDVAVEKADSSYIEVAAASVIARDEALKQLKHLSEKAGFELPKGSSNVAHALEELKKRGLQFSKFVKTNFSNVRPYL
jgi:ribonuclease HIII